jgi:arylsulfatase A
MWKIVGHISRWISCMMLVAGMTITAYAADRPNVIMIYADDLGTLDLNCYGSDDLSTPNLDGLADEGVRFSQFYVAAAVCSPSRGALMTGRYPLRNGITNNSMSLHASEETIAELLKPAGYSTAIIGKWHMGEAQGPNGDGFDYSLVHMGGCVDNFSHFNYGKEPWGKPPHRHDLWRNGIEAWESGTHFGDLIAREAITYIDQHKDGPFFMYLPFNTPHYPVQPYDKWMDYYHDLPAPRRAYAALVSTLDEQIGRIINHVDRVGLRENTLIFFISDHGHSTEARTNYGGGNPGPYRGAKFSVFEGGVRVPAVVSMPGRIPQGIVRDQMAINMDVLPTIAEICGVMPKNAIDGKSLMPIIKSASAPTQHDVLYFHWGNPKAPEPQWAVREGNWKLVVNAADTEHKSKVQGDEKIFLSDMSRDVTERNNLAKDHPDIVKRLTDMHTKWFKFTGH